MNDAQRFSILCTKYYMFMTRNISQRTQEITVKKQGVTLASKLLIYSRGKVTETHYYITSEGITESNP